MPQINYSRPWLTDYQTDAFFTKKRYSLIEGSTKSGKAQPLTSTIWTPDGPIKMADVKIGTVVLTPTGTARVIGVYPQEHLRPVFRIIFQDGSEVECDHDHLWEIETYDTKKKIYSVADLLGKSETWLSDSWVPRIEPVQFNERPVPLDPYLLGLLIGDGGTNGNTVKISGVDEEILNAVRGRLPPGHTLKHESGCDYRITSGFLAEQHKRERTHIRHILDDLGLCCLSHEKRIPSSYKYNSIAVRLEVLRGIMDTDGSVDDHGQPMLEQTSPGLALDVKEIVESLGGYVRSNLKLNSGYRDKSGKFVQCRAVYRQLLVVKDARDFFSLDRKKRKAKVKKKTGNRILKRVELVRFDKTQCIEIDDQRHLYLTDNFIPTHNTAPALVWLFERAALTGAPGRAYWWVAPVYTQAQIAFERFVRGIPRSMCEPHNTKMIADLPNGARVHFKSGENPDNLYGDDVYDVVIDEASRVDDPAWYAVRSTLTATGGRARIIGNVKGRNNWFYKMARVAERGHPEMHYSKITCLDAVKAGILPQKEIDDAREQLPPHIFAELYMAEAQGGEGRVYQNFSKVNIRDDIVDTGGTLLVGADFNVAPLSACIGIKAVDELHIFDEITIMNGDTEMLCSEILRRYPKRQIVCFPDPSGKSRRTSAVAGATDFSIIRAHGISVVAPNKAPLIVDRVNNVNAMILNSVGRRRLFVHPRCRTVIAGLEDQQYKPDTKIPDKANGMDHMNDALGYLCVSEFPIPGMVGGVQFMKVSGF